MGLKSVGGSSLKTIAGPVITVSRNKLLANTLCYPATPLPKSMVQSFAITVFLC